MILNFSAFFWIIMLLKIFCHTESAKIASVQSFTRMTTLQAIGVLLVGVFAKQKSRVLLKLLP